MTPTATAHPEGPLPILLGPAAAPLRRRLGPLAWCALEVLATEADSTGAAHVSVRALAGHLGVAKNTAHRAVVALVHAGLVTPETRRQDDGTFGPATYRLDLEPDVITRSSAAVPARAAASNTSPGDGAVDPLRRRRSRRRPAVTADRHSDQLSLLEVTDR